MDELCDAHFIPWDTRNEYAWPIRRKTRYQIIFGGGKMGLMMYGGGRNGGVEKASEPST